MYRWLISKDGRNGIQKWGFLLEQKLLTDMLFCFSIRCYVFSHIVKYILLIAAGMVDNSYYLLMIVGINLTLAPVSVCI